MKNNTSKVFIVVVILIVVILLIFQNKTGNPTDQTAESAETALTTLQTMVNSDSYHVEVTDENGEKHVLEGTNKTRLAELIAATIQNTQEESISASGPQLSVRVYADTPETEVVLVIYDMGEDTNIGTLQYNGEEFLVQNCGEVFNYLAEIGFFTQR